MKKNPYLVFSLLASVVLVAGFWLMKVDAEVMRSVATDLHGCANGPELFINLFLSSFIKGVLAACVFMLPTSIQNRFTPPDASGTASGRTPEPLHQGEQQ